MVASEAEVQLAILVKAGRVATAAADPASQAAMSALSERALAVAAELGATASVITKCLAEGIEPEKGLAFMPAQLSSSAYGPETVNAAVGRALRERADDGWHTGGKRKGGPGGCVGPTGNGAHGGGGSGGGGSNWGWGWGGGYGGQWESRGSSSSGPHPWLDSQSSGAGPASTGSAPATRSGKGGKRSGN